MGFSGGSDSKESACSVEDLGLIPGLGRSLGKGMAIHSSILTENISYRCSVQCFTMFKGYSLYSSCKMLAVFPMLYHISFILYLIICIS